MEEALGCNFKHIWLQQGLFLPQNLVDEVAKRGATVIEDRCLKVEYVKMLSQGRL